MKLLDFMIVGAQKSGTTALSTFLAQHPQICMADPKETHAFDHPDYSGRWTANLLDEFYGGFFSHAGEESCWGEATPIYFYLSSAAEQIQVYNPDIKFVLILRDPVERAISHYQMARSEGYENLSFWLALLLEPLRIALSPVPLADHSTWRENSYRGRGLYAKQMRRFLKRFPKGQLLVLRQEDLLNQHDETLALVQEFLGLPSMQVSPSRENVTERTDHGAYRVTRWLLRISYWPDLLRLRALVPFSLRDWFLGS